MKTVHQTSQFKKDLKRLQKRGKDLDKLAAVLRVLAEGEALEPRFRDHALSGNWVDSRDCHVEPDWVLIYRTTPESLFLERTGSNSDLFN